jgi:hypothetical protein
MSNFIAHADEFNCYLSRTETPEDRLELSPSEVSKAIDTVGLALRMETMPVLPDHITNSPFVIRFSEDDYLRLERRDKDGSLKFVWREGDDLILAFQSAEKIAINERTVVRSARGAGTVSISDNPFT